MSPLSRPCGTCGAHSARGEQTPPLFYAITRASFWLFGVNNLSIRLPEMLAFWMASACLYVYVRRATSALAGLVAATLPLVTTAFQYSYEARPYALVIGFGALALLAWQSVALGRRRAIWISVLHSVSPQRARATTTDCSSCSPLPRGSSHAPCSADA